MSPVSLAKNNLTDKFFRYNTCMPHSAEKLKALILAAGFGTRLGELGQKTAKGLFPNAQGKSIFDLLIKNLQEQSEIDEIAVVTNNRFYEQYQTAAKKFPDLNIKIINDGVDNSENRLGSLGDLELALTQLNWWEENILITPSDRTPEKFLPKLINLFFQHQTQAAVTTITKRSKKIIKNRFGCIEINVENKIINFEEKPQEPKSDYASIPFYIYPSAALNLLKSYKKSGRNMDSPGNFIPWLLKNEFPIYALATNDNSFDIGNKQELENFQNNHHG